MKKLFLHIGTHKTGTTSLQNFFLKNKNKLHDCGFYYPTEGSYFFKGEMSQSLLAHSLKGVRPKYILSKEVYTKESTVSEIQYDIKNNVSNNVLVSSEHFSLFDNYQDVEAIKDTFSPFFAEIVVIVYSQC